MVRLETKQDVKDFVRGCTFLGTGGGGLPGEGKEWLLEDIEEGKEIELQDLESISDDGWYVCPFLMGSIAPETDEVKEKKKKLGLTDEKIGRPLVKAIEKLEEYKDIKIDGIIPVELGGANTPGPVDAAMQMDKTIVDGDYAGRAIPEIEQTTPVQYNKDLTPITCVDTYGNEAIVEKGINPSMVERIGKFISDTSFGLNGDAGILMKGSELKEVAIGNTLSESFEVGKVIREAREKNEDPVKAVIEEVDGWLLFEGEVTNKDWDDREGYYWGTHELEGINEFEDNKFKYWFKNENHMSWLNGEEYVMSPDLIIAVERETGEPKTNPGIEEGDELAIIGIKARDMFRTEKGIEVLGPQHFDFDMEYTPIEDIME